MNKVGLLWAAIMSNTPVLLWGPPGVAKTSTVEAMAAALDRHCETVIGSVREPADVAGYPKAGDSGVTEYTIPPYIQRLIEAEKGVLFLDEITTGPPATMAVQLRLVQERYAGDTRLPETVSIVGAANPPEMAPNGNAIAPATANRWFHLDWTLSTSDWLAAYRKGFRQSTLINANGDPYEFDKMPHPDAQDMTSFSGIVDSYMQSHSNALLAYPKPSEEAGRGWPSPRSWHNLSKIWPWLYSEDGQQQAAAGIIGRAAADQFFRFYKGVIDQLPTTTEVLTKGLDWSEYRPDELHAVVSALSSFVISEQDNMDDPNNPHPLLPKMNKDELVESAFKTLAEGADKGHVSVTFVGMFSLINAEVKCPPKYMHAFVQARRKVMAK